MVVGLLLLLSPLGFWLVNLKKGADHLKPKQGDHNAAA
jgi:hypothetical protein